MTMFGAIVVGLYGDMPVQIDPATVSFSESTGRPVDPPSLFEAQVQVRICDMIVISCFVYMIYMIVISCLVYISYAPPPLPPPSPRLQIN